jgi:alkylation response protein AidB-like acyl-CoA dehydrogenase
MDAISAADVAQFKQTLRAAFGAGEGTEEVSRQMAPPEGWDRALWKRLCTELEPTRLMLPVEHGGSGMSAVEMAYVLEEVGAATLCAPLLSTAALAAPLLLALGDADALAEHSPGLCAGTVTATVALAEQVGRSAADGVRNVAEQDGDGVVLSGVKEFVVDGASADLLLVVARAGEDGPPGVYAVRAGAPGLQREALVGLDPTRRLARVTLDQTPVSRVLLAAEQTGGAQACLDMTAEYARTRFQFGRAIGSFQAIKQRLADMLVKVESSRSAVYAAARILAQGPTGDDPEHPVAARIAALTAGEAFGFASAQCIQLHGGIGFTWEHDATCTTSEPGPVRCCSALRASTSRRWPKCSTPGPGCRPNDRI